MVLFLMWVCVWGKCVMEVVASVTWWCWSAMVTDQEELMLEPSMTPSMECSMTFSIYATVLSVHHKDE